MPEEDEGTQGTEGQQEGTGGTGGDQQANSNDGTGNANQGDQGAAQDVSALPAWAQQALRQARAEAGAARTNAKKTAAEEARTGILKELGKALGFTKDETPDPARLAADLEARNGALNTARQELAVLKSAGRAQADPDALLDSRTFMAKVGKLNPEDSDFADQVNDLIAAEVKANPRFKVAAAGKSGGEIRGGGNGASKDDADWDTIEKRVRESRGRR